MLSDETNGRANNGGGKKNMKLLIIAPGFHPPWTEGRKNFVRDLICHISYDVELTVLSTCFYEDRFICDRVPIIYTPNCNKYNQLFLLNSLINKTLISSDKFDIVIHFPFGTFMGVRGISNVYSIIKINYLAKKVNIPCLTILYSMTNGRLSLLSKIVNNMAVAEGDDWSGFVVNPGIRCEKYCADQVNPFEKKLLFMAGYTENSKSLLKSIIYDRGLIDIIKIGDRLAEQGFCLSVAIPLLKSNELRMELESIVKSIAPKLKMYIYTSVNTIELMVMHSIYLFPFRKNYTRFIPTSVLEAMASGLPVICSDLPMFKPLIGNGDNYCKSYSAKDNNSLFHSIMEVNYDRNETMNRINQASAMVSDKWDIRTSAHQIINICNKLLIT